MHEVNVYVCAVSLYFSLLIRPFTLWGVVVVGALPETDYKQKSTMTPSSSLSAAHCDTSITSGCRSTSISSQTFVPRLVPPPGCSEVPDFDLFTCLLHM